MLPKKPLSSTLAVTKKRHTSTTNNVLKPGIGKDHIYNGAVTISVFKSIIIVSSHLSDGTSTSMKVARAFPRSALP